MKYALLLLIFIAIKSNAQVTTAEIRGEITSSQTTLKEAFSITAIHQSTGTTFSSLSEDDGSYVLSNLKTGGPYVVYFRNSVGDSISFRDIYLSLGEVKIINPEIKEKESEIEEIEIVANRLEMDGQKGGTGKTIDKETIQNLPSLNRSLSDATKLTPQSAGNSYGGTNYRLNNLNIDGMGSNDAFGFQEPASGAGGSTAAGTPGALAKTQPISLDAIEEVQVNISPYDVRLGNFTGASINAVTRSGTNRLDGGVYVFNRNQYTTGRSVDAERTRISNYSDLQTGFRIGGALKKDKVFYFVNGEFTDRIETVSFAPGSSTSNFQLNEIQALQDTLMNRYGFESGTLSDAKIAIRSYKIFGRVDWNINENNQALIRVNYVSGYSDNFERTPTILNLQTQSFRHKSENINVIAELKSKINNQWNNKLILGFGNQHDQRDPFGEQILPHIEITYNTSNIIFAGTYRESAIFQMKQKSYELTDNLVYNKRKHTLTIGTHVEIFDFDYHFVTPYNGRWAYRSLSDFYGNRPSRIRGTYNLDDNSFSKNFNEPSADFNVVLPSIYAQHDYRFSRRFLVTYGVRIESTLFPNSPELISSFSQTPAFSGIQSGIKNQLIVSPRVGFNYSVTKDERLKLRGGSGIFLGRMPFAWMAYAYIYNGNQFGNIDIRPSGVVNLVSSNFSDLETIQPGLKEINIIDRNYKLPKVWRSNLAFDYKTKKGFLFTLEGLFTKTVSDVLFKTINAKDSTASLQGADNRPVYITTSAAGKENPNFTNVFLVTNTDKGFKYSISLSVSKEFKSGFSFFSAYNYGVSKDISNGVRVSPQANWEWNQTILANDPELSYSNFDIRHRSISNLNYTKNWKNGRHKSQISLVFNTQSGSPYSYIYNGDLNRDGSPNNDLIYVPANQNEINLVDITDGSGNVITSAAEQWINLDNYISSDSYLSKMRGEYAQRNGARTPWNTSLDLRLSNQIYFGKNKKQNIQLMLDIINITNLIYKKWGYQYFVPNTTNAGYSLLTVRSVNGSGVATYQFNSQTSKPYQVDPIASRWQMQLGIRYNF
jgi:hypothetical protein